MSTPDKGHVSEAYINQNVKTLSIFSSCFIVSRFHQHEWQILLNILTRTQDCIHCIGLLYIFVNQILTRQPEKKKLLQLLSRVIIFGCPLEVVNNDPNQLGRSGSSSVNNRQRTETQRFCLAILPLNKICVHFHSRCVFHLNIAVYKLRSLQQKTSCHNKSRFDQKSNHDNWVTYHQSFARSQYSVYNPNEESKM